MTTNNYFVKLIANTYDMTGAELVNDTELENAVAAELEECEIEYADIYIYTDTETHTCRWVYVMTEQNVEYEVLVKRNFCKTFDIDDIDFIVY